MRLQNARSRGFVVICQLLDLGTGRWILQLAAELDQSRRRKPATTSWSGSRLVFVLSLHYDYHIFTLLHVSIGSSEQFDEGILFSRISTLSPIAQVVLCRRCGIVKTIFFLPDKNKLTFYIFKKVCLIIWC